MPTLFSIEPPVLGKGLLLGIEAATHLRALRVSQGEVVRVVDGAGSVAKATILKVNRNGVQLDISEVNFVARNAGLHLLLPVADKDRMLLLAEKAVELGAASWRPVIWRRSQSVAGRGDSTGFTRRLTARMVAALEQCGGAWLPDIFPAAKLERAVAAAPKGTRLVLDASAASWFPTAAQPPLVVAVGPEGGMEPDEMEELAEAGFKGVRLASDTLRFETAGIAALAMGQAALCREGHTIDG